MGDAARVFAWRNDPEIVALGSSQRPVIWDEHLRWYEETVASGNRVLFIITEGEQPIGVVRFDRSDEEECVVSTYLDKPVRGRGLGVTALRLACGSIFERWGITRVLAFIREDNARGRSAFLKAGFNDIGTHRTCPARHRVLALTSPGLS
jgi:RimJ/RimL family protein N-acetyltransferase